MIEWEYVNAAVWRSQQNYLRPIKNLDPIRLEELIGIDTQKNLVVHNTEQFLAGKPANHVLLWGARGTGKSSVVKAIVNQYHQEGLRLIEVDRDALFALPQIVDEIREINHRFIIYCDDLSFQAQETAYRGLKSILEGSIELPPPNVLLYATSNRRHLIPEFMQENLESSDEEIHYRDSVEEKMALADRFGLWIGFYPMELPTYLKVVDFYFRHQKIHRERLHQAAKQFAMQRGCANGRTAKQFFQSYSKES